MSLNRLARTNTAALLLTLALAAPTWAAGTTAESASRPAVDASSIHIDNFGQVNAHYYRGAQPRGRDYADLAAIGVKTVIDLTKDGDPTEAAQAQAAGMRFYRIPMTTHETPSADKLSQFLRLVADPANQPVYVHCQGGRHRTGVMTAAYRMTEEGWNADQAFAEMKRYKFGADYLHSEFKQFVYAYHPDVVVASAAAAPTKSGS